MNEEQIGAGLVVVHREALAASEEIREPARVVVVVSEALDVVLEGVDGAPPDGGGVHVLLVGHPYVQSVGVIELAAEGGLTLK